MGGGSALDPRLDATSDTQVLLRFSGLVFDPGAATLAGRSGEAIPLTRGELSLLRSFLRRPGRVLSRDALLDAVSNRPLEPFDRSIDVLVGRLRKKIEPDPKEPRLIVTVSGEGYRFDGLKHAANPEGQSEAATGARPAGVALDSLPREPDAEAGARPFPEAFGLFAGAAFRVRERFGLVFVGLLGSRTKEAVRPWQAAATGSEPTPYRRVAGIVPHRRSLAVLSALCLGGIVVAGLWGAATQRFAQEIPTHLSMVVLPFDGLSSEPNQDYFANGLTENITTDLSHIPGSFVISANTALQLGGKDIPFRELGKELGVRYVVDGAVQRERNRVRVNARLVDAATGAILWAERFEEEILDLFKLQDQIVAQIGNTLGFELIKAEIDRNARSSNIDAVDMTMRGHAMLWRGVRQRGLDEKRASYSNARELFEGALALEPDYPAALAGAAQTYTAEYAFGWKDVDIDYETKILGLADRAIVRAPHDARAYAAKSIYLRITNRIQGALQVADRGLAVSPNSAQLFGARASAKNMLGRFEEARSDAQQAIRLSPRDPQLGLRYAAVGDAELGLERLDAAVEAYRKAIDLGYRTRVPDLAAAYALQGRMDEAKTALTEALRADPRLTVKSLQDRFPVPQPVIDGLRKAGLPEQ